MQAVVERFENPGLARRSSILGARVGQRWIFRSDSGYLGRQKLTDYSVLWMSAALVVMGVAILIHAGLGLSKSNSPARWPTTYGRIVSVQVIERGYGNETRWFPQITYQYALQGHTVASTRLSPGPAMSWRDRNEANQFLERYITRSRVLVYYNPNSVTDAVLEPHSGGLEPSTWVGMAIVLFGLGILLIYDRVS
jgi:Protein of unknown function (DUF3592)